MLVVLITFGTGAFSAATLDTSTEVSSKISPDLQSKLSEMSNDDTVEVAVWLNHTDEETLKNAYINELQKSINRGIITTDIATATALFDESSNLEIEPLSIEKTQQLLSIRRSSYSNVIVANNDAWIYSVKDNFSDNTEVLYSSIYAPAILMKVNKSDLARISNLDEVENISYNSYDITLCDISSQRDNVKTSVLEDNPYPYGVWQEVTRIDDLHSMGYTGLGIKVGLFELALPNTNIGKNINHTYSASQENQSNELYFYHANYTGSILAGYYNGYSGVVPDATVYCAGYKTNAIEPVDALISKGINVLSISLAIAPEGVYNGYGYFSKYLDYISFYYKTLICIGSSNSSSTPSGMPESAFAYNAITVGNINDMNTLEQSDDLLDIQSLYNVSNTKAYKPDLCAPGTCVKTSYTPNGGGGTSAATPVVSGISALLMGINSTLIGKPTLVKSILMSSADRIPNMGDIYSSVSSTTPALSRSYGAGLVDAMNAFTLLGYSNRWRCIETQSALDSEEPYTMNITVSQNDINSAKKIAVCLTWLQKNISTSGLGNTGISMVTKYRLSVNDPTGDCVACSYYLYDRKQYVYFRPTITGTYKIVIEKKGIANNTPLSFSYYKSN